MNNRKSGIFYGILIAFACTAMGMVIASRLDLTPRSAAGPLNIPATNSTPITGTIDATTFRNIAKAENPSVVSIIATKTQDAPDMSELFQMPGFRQQAPGRRPNNGRGQTVFDPWHYVPVLARKPGALRNGARGKNRNRVWARAGRSPSTWARWGRASATTTSMR